VGGGGGAKVVAMGTAMGTAIGTIGTAFVNSAAAYDDDAAARFVGLFNRGPGLMLNVLK
jgi:hypothetical protein